jgi:hypothetical protein
MDWAIHACLYQTNDPLIGDQIFSAIPATQKKSMLHEIDQHFFRGLNNFQLESFVTICHFFICPDSGYEQTGLIIVFSRQSYWTSHPTTKATAKATAQTSAYQSRYFIVRRQTASIQAIAIAIQNAAHKFITRFPVVFLNIILLFLLF